MKPGVYRTICPFCHASCGLIITVGKSGIEEIEGDPDHPSNRGYHCRKTLVIPEILTSEQRLTVPLRRTKKGFEKITWEQAIDFAAERLGELRQKYGPTCLARNAGAPVSYYARDGFVEFMGAFGSPNFTGAGNLCMVPRMTAFSAVMGTRPEPDLNNSQLLLFWGSNAKVTDRFGGYCAFDGLHKIFSRARKRGAKIIAIDIVASETVQEADEWLRINPGTDGALALAMMNVIINHDLYDHEFVHNYTTGFDKLKAHVQQYTPAWAAPITGIPEKKIIELAITYATTKPAALCDGNGFDMYTNDVDNCRAAAMLVALTGNIDVPGGNVILPFARQSTLPTKRAPIETRLWYDTFPLFREVPFVAVKESLLRNEPERPRAMIAHHSNPLLVQANQRRTREALQRLEFFMVSELFFTATCEVADLILPNVSEFETYTYKAYSSFEGGFLAYGPPIAEPLGATRSMFEVEYEIARKMGLEHQYPFHDAESWLDFMLLPTGVSRQQLEAEQIVYATGKPQYQKYRHTGFSTPSGKVEFYSQEFAAKGLHPMPVYLEPATEPLRATPRRKQAFPLLGSSKRPGLFVHTNFRNLKVMQQFYPDPLVWIHPEDANERGIVEGETVEVETPVGKIDLVAKVSEVTKQGLVLVDFGWGNPADNKGSANILTSDAYWDPISGATPNRLFQCEVSKKS